ncbi:unnamed protein product [Boreogadus saida]
MCQCDRVDFLAHPEHKLYGASACSLFKLFLKSLPNVYSCLASLSTIILASDSCLGKSSYGGQQQPSGAQRRTDKERDTGLGGISVARDLKPTYASQIKGQKMEDKYPLTSKPTGLCLIINNENYIGGPPRRGTEKDAESLATVFSWLGFQVLMCKDNTASDMDEVTKLLANPRCMARLQKYKLEEWSDGRFTGLSALPQHGDAFVCCVLSHGEEDKVLGIDFGDVPIRKITSAFIAENCRDLIGKPKVFFIEACQGRGLQPGVTVDGYSIMEQGKEYFPIEADFLVSKATVAKYQALRHTKTGSYFIQSLCEQLRKGCSRGEDILKILVRVNAEVSKICLIKDFNPEKIWMQMTEFSVTLRHNLVFSPCSS